MTARKSPAKPVANLAAARAEQQAARKQAQAAHPAGKAQPKPAAKQPAKKPAPAKAAKPTKPATGPHQGVVRAGVVSRGGTSRGGSRRGGSSGVVTPEAAEKRTYSATARCGKVNSRVSATPMLAALDVKVSGKKQAHWSAGVIVGFYATLDAAQKVADEINGGAVKDWSDAIVVKATAAAKAAS